MSGWFAAGDCKGANVLSRKKTCPATGQLWFIPCWLAAMKDEY